MFSFVRVVMATVPLHSSRNPRTKPHFYSSVCRWPCLLILATWVEQQYTWMQRHRSCVLSSFPSDKYPEVGEPNYRMVWFLVFWRLFICSFHNNYVLIYMPANNVRKDSSWSRIPLQFGFVFSWWLVILSMLYILAAWISYYQNPALCVRASVGVSMRDTISLCSSGWPRTHILLALSPELGLHHTWQFAHFLLTYLFCSCWLLVVLEINVLPMSIWQRSACFKRTVSLLIISSDLKKLLNCRNQICQLSFLVSVLLKPFSEKLLLCQYFDVFPLCFSTGVLDPGVS